MSRAMPSDDSDSFKEFVIDQLCGVAELRCQRMFGGFGLYAGGRFFGIIAKGRLYFKTDAASRADFEKFGMEAFQASKEQTLKNYFEVPPHVLENSDALGSWATRAVQVARGG